VSAFFNLFRERGTVLQKDVYLPDAKRATIKSAETYATFDIPRRTSAPSDGRPDRHRRITILPRCGSRSGGPRGRRGGFSRSEPGSPSRTIGPSRGGHPVRGHRFPLFPRDLPRRTASRPPSSPRASRCPTYHLAAHAPQAPGRGSPILAMRTSVRRRFPLARAAHHPSPAAVALRSGIRTLRHSAFESGLELI